MRKYCLFSLITLFFVTGCLERPAELIGNGEFRSPKSQKTYDRLTFGDLTWDWTTRRPSKEDSTIYFCVPALSVQQFDQLGCWYEADENVSIDCNSIAGNYLLLITSQGELETQLFTHSSRNDLISELQSKRVDIVPLECILFDKEPQISSNPKIEHIRVLALDEADKWEMITSREIVSRRRIAQDLAQEGYQEAFVLETGTIDAGWYRYGDAVFDIGRHPKSAPFQNNWLVARLQ